MLRKFLVFIVFVLTINCQNKQNKQGSIEDFIPNDAQVVMHINSIDVFKSALKNNELLSKTKFKSIFENNLTSIDSLKISGPLLLCISENSKYTFISQQKHIGSKELLKQNSIRDSIWVFSTSNSKSTPLKNATGHPYKKFSKLTEPNATISIYIAKPEQYGKEFSLFNNVLLDVKATPKYISLSGIYTDSNSKWNHLFENILPKTQQLSSVVPDDIENFETFIYSDFQQFSKNLKALDSTLVFSELSKTLLETSQEIGSIKTSNGSAILLHSIDISTSKEALVGYQEQLQSFRSVPIYKFENDSIFNQNFEGLLPKLNISNYTVIDEFLIFSENETLTEEIISKHINKNNLNNSKSFQNTQQKLSDEISYQKILTPKNLTNILNTIFGTSLSRTDLEAYKNSMVQVIRDDEVVHLNAQIEHFRPTQKQKKINEIFSMTLDATILGDVQFVKNHKTQQKDIVVQDIENQLYLVSNQGVVRWKKKLSGPIVGRINQVDLYKNGRFQWFFQLKIVFMFWIV